MKIVRVAATPLNVPLRISLPGIERQSSLEACVVEVPTSPGEPPLPPPEGSGPQCLPDDAQTDLEGFQAGDTLQVQMTSIDFDPALAIYRKDGNGSALATAFAAAWAN